MTHHHEPDTDPRRLRAFGDLLARGQRRHDDGDKRAIRRGVRAQAALGAMTAGELRQRSQEIGGDEALSRIPLEHAQSAL